MKENRGTKHRDWLLFLEWLNGSSQKLIWYTSVACFCGQQRDKLPKQAIRLGLYLDFSRNLGRLVLYWQPPRRPVSSSQHAGYGRRSWWTEELEAQPLSGKEISLWNKLEERISRGCKSGKASTKPKYRPEKLLALIENWPELVDTRHLK